MPAKCEVIAKPFLEESNIVVKIVKELDKEPLYSNQVLMYGAFETEFEIFVLMKERTNE